jgi:DnaJ-domain-containing protein 1
VRRETVEEVAREFQLDERPTASAGAQASAMKQSGESAPLVQSLLQNLANLIDRLGHQDPEIETPTERKP